MIIIKPSRLPRILSGIAGLGLLGWSVYNLIGSFSGSNNNVLCAPLVWLAAALACLSFAAGSVETTITEQGLSKRNLFWMRRTLPWDAVQEAHLYTLGKQVYITSVSAMQTYIRLVGSFGETTIEYSSTSGRYWLDDFLQMLARVAPHIAVFDEREVADPHEEIK